MARAGTGAADIDAREIDVPGRAGGTGGPVLAGRGLTAGYGVQAAIRGVDLEVHAGEIVALLGPNGAGKTTTVLALAGALPLMAGDVLLDGRPLPGALHLRARKGVALITQERSTIMGLSVADNLRLGGVQEDEVFAVFPELADHRSRPAALLSGGQQQMLTVGRALCRHPKVLLADELSLGLAPIVVDRLLDALRAAARDGTAVVIVEQHVEKALGVADRAYVLAHGEVQISGDSDTLSHDSEMIRNVYLGA